MRAIEAFVNFLLSTLAAHLYAEPKVVKRGSGEEVVELVPVLIKAQLGLLFNSRLGFFLCKLPVLRNYQLKHSQELRQRYDAPDSRADIQGFVEDYGVQLGELEKPLEEYHTLNEFFARKLRPGARPLYRPEDDACAVQPADARVVAFPSVQLAQQLWVKGRGFNLEGLLGARLRQGSQHAIVISRLAPDDYHRFNSPVPGTLHSTTPLGGQLFSVKAAAVNSATNVFCENRRVVLCLDSPAFGIVWVVAVGAAQVGSVQLSVATGERIAKGQELGWFQYGGSSIVTVFDSARVRLDADLLANSEASLETLVRVCTSMGCAA